MADDTRDWHRNRAMWTRILENRTGVGVDAWNRRIAKERLDDEASLRAWLTSQGVTGYGQSLLVMERFGYPDFLLATADELIDAQYEDRPGLRPIFDGLLAAAKRFGKVEVQARKTYVSLLSPRRTFARVQATTKGRVDLGLRLERQTPVGRLVPSRIHATMRLQIGLSTVDDVDDEVLQWLRRAYDENS